MREISKLPFSLFLAVKYMKPRRSLVSVISIISVIGVMLGVAILIIVLAVMTGFDDMWREKILSFDAHITVSSGAIMEQDELMRILTNIEGVVAAAPTVQGLVFVQHHKNIFTPVMRGIDVKLEKAISQIPHHIIAGKFEVKDKEALIGIELASRLGTSIGDKLLIYSPHTFIKGSDEIRLPIEVKVAGLFEMGMFDYDIGFVIVPLEIAQELYDMDDAIHSIRVITKDPFNASAVAQKIKQNLKENFPAIRVQTWMELNRQLFGALQVEKNMMFFLLIFIVLVAAFGITNTLIIVVVRKTKEIGLLKALGFSSFDVMNVFFWQGAIQGTIGTIFGIALGILTLHYRNDMMRFISKLTGMDLLPKALYHIGEIPSHLMLSDVFLVAFLAIFICTLSGIIPALWSTKLEPAQALRYE